MEFFLEYCFKIPQGLIWKTISVLIISSVSPSPHTCIQPVSLNRTDTFWQFPRSKFFLYVVYCLKSANIPLIYSIFSETAVQNGLFIYDPKNKIGSSTFWRFILIFPNMPWHIMKCQSANNGPGLRFPLGVLNIYIHQTLSPDIPAILPLG